MKSLTRYIRCNVRGYNILQLAINHRKKSIEKYTDECPHTYDISTY